MQEKRLDYQEIKCRVERVRGIYSRIGEPLPADIIIDLYRHLGTLLLAEEEMPTGKRKKNQAYRVQ